MLQSLVGSLKTARIVMADALAPKRVPIPSKGVDYRGKIVLAPMVRSGELPCRLTALHYGADLVWGPETIDRALIGCTRKYCERTKTIKFTRHSSNQVSKDAADAKESVIFRLHPGLEQGKLIFQMGTAKPELAVAAAKLIAGDVAGIDVNSGCPKPFSTTGGMGAALLKDPERLCSILKALVEEVGKPWQIGISVKIRILPDPAETESLVKQLVQTGITALTVHCRTPPMRPRERAIRDQLRTIIDICHAAGVACVMNGDVENREKAMELMTEFGADGAMLATAAERDPSVFRSQADGGRAPWKEVVRFYLETAMSVENRWGNTKFTLAQLVPGKADKNIGISRCKDHIDTVKAIGFDDLLELAQKTDNIVGLANRTVSSKATKRVAAKEEQAEVKRVRLDVAEQEQKTMRKLEAIATAHNDDHSIPAYQPAVVT